MSQFEILVTNCENNHTTVPLDTDYTQLRPRSYTENSCDLLFTKLKSKNAAFTFDGVTTYSSEVSGSETAGHSHSNRAPLVSRDPQTSSLDRCSPDCRPFYHQSPTPKKSQKQKKTVPFFSKRKKNRSKSAHTSPLHLAVQQPRPLNFAAVQDFGSSDPEDQIESNLDFGFRSGDTGCWAGSNESFSDLDGGVTRSNLLSPNSFRARSLSCSSYSQTDTELSRSSESINQWASQVHCTNAGSYNSYCTSCALRKSCENVFAAVAAAKRFKNSSLCRIGGQQSKSSGGLIMQKFSKKLSKLSNFGGGGGGSGGKGGEKSGGGLKKKKGRANSISNLENTDDRLTQSMEQLSPLPVDEKEGVKGFSTPGVTPIGTPRMPRSRSKSKLTRRSSEPDLEGALSTLFRSGSKKNLAQDAAEALFKAIEQDSSEEVQQQLKVSGASLLNMTNEDDFLPVDLAAMLNHQAIVRLLLEKGGKDSAKFCRDPFARFSRITTLLMEAERELDHLKCELVTQNVGGNSKVKEDLQRRLREWEWKAHILRKMKENYEEAGIPGPPSNVCLHVTSNRSLMVTFGEPEDMNGAMVTRYKIEWCRSDKFTPIVGDFVMTDLRSMEYTIPDLNKGEAYFVRVYAYNMKGFGPAQMAMPNSAVPSSWHDIIGSRPRYEGATYSMQVIAAQLSNLLSSIPPAPNGNPTTNKTSKTTVKKSISKLFGSTVKFHKALKAGVYISSLVYTKDDKILTTVDDQIPIVEVSDSHSSNIGSDFVWLAKVACTWKNIKSMATATEQYVSSPAVQFRHKLLCAILNLQAALGIPNLGLLHPIPFKDSQGAIVFVIVHQCNDPNSLQTRGSLKWSNLPRLRRKRLQPLLSNHGTVSPEQMEALPVSDRIVVDAEDVIAHHKNSTSTLTRGLYLGYLKGRSTVASMRVICSREYPNVLPHHKIRDNPNISSEEWQWLKSLSSPSPPSTPETSPSHTHSPSPGPSPNLLSSSPLSLQQTLLPAVDTFLHNLGIDRDEVEKHQLYCHEAIELNEDITLLLVMPSHDHLCTPPGSSDHFAKLPNFVPLPINTFEIMQLFTYQQAFMANYSVVSARLEVEFLASQQRMREAFSNAEGAAAKKMHKELEDLQEKTEMEWKQMRWIDDAVQNGRDVALGTEILLPVKTMREVVGKQQEHFAKRQREITAMIPSPQHRGMSPASGYLRVFPAYNTGLIKGTSVKLYITIMTTTSDVIRLVVHQLEKTRVERGIPGRMIMEDDLNDFYLVAISGNQERVLNEDYNPLQLQQQSQAQKCHLYVRRKSEQLRFTEQVTTV